MERRVLVKVVVEIFVALLFMSLLAFTLLKAYGYQYDLLERSLVKKTIVEVASEFEDVELYFDGEKVADKTPHRIFNVDLARHNIRLEKEGFITFEESFVAEEDIISRFDDIQLFPENLDDFGKDVLDEIDAADIFIKRDSVFYKKGADFYEYDPFSTESNLIEDFSLEEAEILDEDLEKYFKNVQEIKVLTDDHVWVENDDLGVLYKRIGQNFEKLMLMDLYAYDLLSDESELLYSDGFNIKKLTFFDAEDLLLTRFSKKIQSLKWYKDSHILYRLEGEDWSVCDQKFKHCYTLKSALPAENIFYLAEKDLFVAKKEKGLTIFSFS